MNIFIQVDLAFVKNNITFIIGLIVKEVYVGDLACQKKFWFGELSWDCAFMFVFNKPNIKKYN